MLLLLLLLCWRLTSVWGLAVASPRTGCCLLASYLSRLVVGCNSLTLTAGWRLLEACWLVLLEVQLASRLPLFRAASNASESRCASFKSSILSHWRMCSFCCRTVMVSYGSSSSRGSRLRCLVPGGEESSQGQTFRSGVCHPGAGARAAEALGPLEARRGEGFACPGSYRNQDMQTPTLGWVLHVLILHHDPTSKPFCMSWFPWEPGDADPTRVVIGC